jgi:methionyl-tRNA formyltransferase
VGTAPFAVPSLKALKAVGLDVAVVITQPDRPGHRLKVTPSAVKVAAKELGLRVEQPEQIRDPSVVAMLLALAPDLVVVVAYGQIIPRAILAIPGQGAVNVHASLLPKHRGAAPIAGAILAGDAETGVTIMKMDEQLDHGPILAVRSTRIDAGEDAAALTKRLADMGAELLVETVTKLGEIMPVGQDHAKATYAPKLSREMGELDWKLPAEEIERKVRAFQPWPGVTLPAPGGRMKILKGHIEGSRYVPEMVQMAGKRPQPYIEVDADD